MGWRSFHSRFILCDCVIRNYNTMSLARTFFNFFLPTCEIRGAQSAVKSFVNFTHPRSGRLGLRRIPFGRWRPQPQPMAHSVSDHLHVMIADYDRFIRTVIPHYETMRAVQLELLARCLPPDGRVIDLGGGTGALARAVAEKFPGVRVEIWDTDPAMVEVARERCAAFGDRVISWNAPLPNRYLPATPWSHVSRSIT